MLKFMKVIGNGNNLKNGQLVIYNDENNEIIEIHSFVHKDSEPDIRLVEEKDLLGTDEILDIIELGLNNPHRAYYIQILKDCKNYIEIIKHRDNELVNNSLKKEKEINNETII